MCAFQAEIYKTRTFAICLCTQLGGIPSRILRQFHRSSDTLYLTSEITELRCHGHKTKLGWIVSPMYRWRHAATQCFLFTESQPGHCPPLNARRHLWLA